MGIFALLRIIFAPKSRINTKKKLIGAPTFLWFFGWFTSGHGVAIIIFFVIFPESKGLTSTMPFPIPEGDFFNPSWPGPLALFELGIDAAQILYYCLPWEAILVIFILTARQSMSFFFDQWSKKRRNSISLGAAISGVPVRIVALHLSIFAGAFLCFIFNTPKPISVFLIIIMDLINYRMYKRHYI